MMWNDQYWYKSGISSTIRADLSDIVIKAQRIKSLERGDLVLDIGCNDGTLLGFYNKEVVHLVGFEPSKNVAREAMNKGYHVINEFFNAGSFNQLSDNKAKIITAISMFYDLENPKKFLEDIALCLDPKGLFIIQQNYLTSMLDQNAFDNICHEHREYYSLNSLERLLNGHNFEIFDLEENDINGGSIRTYIKFKGNNELPSPSERIEHVRKKEKNLKIDTEKPYLDFSERVSRIRSQLLSFLEEQKNLGKRIAIYGASTRGNVSLQYFGLNKKLIDVVADKNPDKWGKKTIGSLIPIVSPEEMRKINPDYLLVNTWHFINEIKEQERSYHERGGKFIVALPQFRVE